jgi:isocitrate dehydrogenase (NAD+)
MPHAVTLIPGDITGPEVAAAVQKIIERAKVAIDWEERPLADRAIPQDVIESLGRTKVALMGFHHAWHQRNDPPPIVKLRKAFGMYANLRPIRTLRGIPTRFDDLDLVVVREITEDIYAHLEHESIPGVYESLKVTTQAACERIARFAFEYARANGRKKVTIVHKANIMKKSDGMFLKVARDIAAGFPDIATEDVIVDAVCMKLVLNPGKFDVLVAGNLYGDIVSDLCAGLVGGASNCPSINVGPELRIYASPHGDPSGLHGTNKGNPLGLLLPALELLAALGEIEAARQIRSAVERALADGIRPVAIGGSAGCNQFAQAVGERLW